MPSTDFLAVCRDTTRASDRPPAGRVCAAPVDPATGLTGIGDERQPHGEREQLAGRVQDPAPQLGTWIPGGLLFARDPVLSRDLLGERPDFDPVDWQGRLARVDAWLARHATESAARGAKGQCR
jgi:hypothetical protein